MANLHLVTGYAGQAHVTAADDGSFNRAIFGSGQYVLDLGSKFAASVVSNNKITIADGDLLMQGRHVRLNEGTTVDLTINNGTQDKLRNDLIVARYTKDSVSGVEEVNLVVIQGTAVTSNPADPEYTSGDIINDHALRNDMPLYRVPLDGLNIGTLVPLFSIAEVVKDGTITTDKLSSGFVLPMVKGGTASTKLANAPDYAIFRKLASSNQMWYTPTNKGAFYAKKENGEPVFGTLPLSIGGTGIDLSSIPPYALIRATSDLDDYPYLYYTATGNGAFYATEANGAGKFGTLPIAQGGTGATSAAAALSNLGGISIKRLWNNEALESSFAAQTLNIDLSAYSLVLVIALAGASLGYRVSTIVPVGWSGLLTGAWGYSPAQGFSRKFFTKTSGGIEFYDGATNGVVDNTVLVPHRVYGIKGVTT